MRFNDSEPLASEPSLPRRTFAAIFIVLAVIGFVLVNRLGLPDGSDEPRDGDGSDVSALPVVRSTSVGQPEVALVPQYLRLDPLVDGWNSEAFNTAAESQFKKLGELLTKPATNETQGRTLVAADFRAHPLRPAELRSAWTDQLTTVTRFDRRVKLRLTASSLPAALDSLRKAFPSGIQRAKFKIVRAELKSSVAQTTVLVQIFGRSATRTIQQNATWECEWRMVNLLNRTF